MIDGKTKEIIDKLKKTNNELTKRKTIMRKNSAVQEELEEFLIILNESEDIIEEYSMNQKQSKLNDGGGPILHSKLEERVEEINDWIANIDKQIDNFFNDIYDKIPGYIFGIIGLFIFLFSTFIAVILYRSFNPNYSIFHNWISELGIGSHGSSIVFNTGWILSSGMILFFHVYQIRNLKEKTRRRYLLKLMAISNIAFTSGIFLVGVFPANLTVQHIIAATFYFLGGVSFFSLYGILASIEKKIPKIHAVIAFFVFMSYILFFLSPYFPHNFSEIGLTITSMEWLTLFTETSMMFVILQHSLFENYFIKKYEKECEKIKEGGINESKFRYRLIKYLEDKKVC